MAKKHNYFSPEEFATFLPRENSYRIPRDNSFKSYEDASADNYSHGGMLFCTMTPDGKDNTWYNLRQEEELTEFYNGRAEDYRSLSSQRFFYMNHMDTIRYARVHGIEGFVLPVVDTFELFCDNIIPEVLDLPL